MIKITIREPRKESNKDFLDFSKYLQETPPKFRQGQNVRKANRRYQLLDKLTLLSLRLPDIAQIYIQNIEYSPTDLIVGFRIEQLDSAKPKYQYLLAISNLWVDEDKLQEIQN